MNLKKLFGTLAVGIELLITGCSPFPEGEPVFAPVDGAYDHEAILQELKSVDPVSALSPALKDFLNEFYAFTGHHNDLRDVSLAFTPDIMEHEGSSAAGKYYPNKTIELTSLPLSPLLAEFFHEVEHQYDSGHNKVWVGEEVFRPLFLYVFDPQIGTSALPYLLLHREQQAGYIPLFWAWVQQSGNPIAEFDGIRGATAATLDSAMSQSPPYVETFPAALEQMREKGSLVYPNHVTPGEIDTFLTYLASQQHSGQPTPDERRRYLNGLQRMAVEGALPNPLFFMHLKPTNDLCNEYQSVIASALDTIDIEEWPVFFSNPFVGERGRDYISQWNQVANQMEQCLSPTL